MERICSEPSNRKILHFGPTKIYYRMFNVLMSWTDFQLLVANQTKYRSLIFTEQDLQHTMQHDHSEILHADAQDDRFRNTRSKNTACIGER